MFISNSIRCQWRTQFCVFSINERKRNVLPHLNIYFKIWFVHKTSTLHVAYESVSFLYFHKWKNFCTVTNWYQSLYVLWWNNGLSCILCWITHSIKMQYMSVVIVECLTEWCTKCSNTFHWKYQSSTNNAFYSTYWNSFACKGFSKAVCRYTKWDEHFLAGLIIHNHGYCYF